MKGRDRLAKCGTHRRGKKKAHLFLKYQGDIYYHSIIETIVNDLEFTYVQGWAGIRLLVITMTRKVNFLIFIMAKLLSHLTTKQTPITEFIHSINTYCVPCVTLIYSFF